MVFCYFVPDSVVLGSGSVILPGFLDHVAGASVYSALTFLCHGVKTLFRVIVRRQRFPVSQGNGERKSSKSFWL